MRGPTLLGYQVELTCFCAECEAQRGRAHRQQETGVPGAVQCVEAWAASAFNLLWQMVWHVVTGLLGGAGCPSAAKSSHTPRDVGEIPYLLADMALTMSSYGPT